MAEWFRATDVPSSDLRSDARAVRESLLADPGAPTRIGRFALTRALGEGAVGTVYEAVDTRSGETVALKVLRRGRRGGDRIFKRELGAIGDVSSPNLVKIYELGRDGDLYFIAMELVEGRDFVQHVRDDGENGAAGRFGRVDFDALRDALKQLVGGLSALHRAGKVHRDVKPSNVLVTPEGRVVLLDFGLVGAFGDPHKLESTLHGHVVGTPAYMAPEQFRAEAPIPASDWYAVGGMLFHALVGYPPFGNGPPDALKSAKTSGIRPVPSQMVPDVPPDLDTLCTSLLDPDPEGRPTADEILALLGHAPDDRRVAVTVHPDAPFVGRHAELARLEQAMAASSESCVVVTVSGPVGVGKTALVRSFLATLRARNCALLSVRCHERDRTTYKTIDRLIDELVRFLQRLPAISAMRLMPRHVHDLAEFFPSLRRLDAVMMTPGAVASNVSRFELRRRATVALGELLGRISDSQPLVVWIDDVQWSDLESLFLLRGILHAKDAPRGLFVASHNADPISTERVLGRLFAVERGTPRVLFDRIELGPLPFADAVNLAVRRVSDRECAEQIARDTGGNPLLISTVASHVEEVGRGLSSERPVAETLQAMLRGLSNPARDFVRVLSIARTALPLRVLKRTLDVRRSAEPFVGELRGLRFIRTQGGSLDSWVEIAHERIREAVLSDLGRPDRLALHGMLGRALAEDPRSNPEEVAYHLRAAGEPRQATQHLLSGADRATARLAYDRAARLYRAALRWTTDEREVATVRFRLADALRQAGYGTRDAEAYLEAAQEHPLSSVERFTLERMAAQELLFRGRLDRAGELVREMLRAMGLSMPRTRIGAVVRLWLRRLQLRFRDLRSRPTKVPKASDLVRFDTVFMLAQGLMIYDPVVGSHLFTRSVFLALRLGEPARLVRALAFESALSAWNGSRSRARALRVFSEAERTAERVDDPYVQGLSALSKAVTGMFVGDLRAATREAQSARAIFRERCSGVAWESHAANLVIVIGHMVLGNFDALAQNAFPMLEEATARDNVYQTVGLRTFTSLAFLADGDLDAAHREIDCVYRDWAYDGFDMQHLGLVLGLMRLELYRGRGADGLTSVHDLWSRLERSMMLDADFIGVFLRAFRGRLAVMAYAESGKAKYRRLALACARRIQRIEFPGAIGDAASLRAGVAHIDGDAHRAAGLYRDAIAAYEREGMPTVAALIRYELGKVLGGTEGRELIRSADAELRRASIRNPPAFVQMYTGIPMSRALPAEET